MGAHGHVRVSARSPRAAARCDRCGFLYNRDTLRFQFDWRGLQLQNLRVLICDRCYDEPQEQLRARILSPDPLPIWNARPEPFTLNGISYDETNYIFDEDQVTMRVTEDGRPRVAENNATDIQLLLLEGGGGLNLEGDGAGNVWLENS